MSIHIGFDFTPPDVPGKVTGEIKYAEDYKKEGLPKNFGLISSAFL